MVKFFKDLGINDYIAVLNGGILSICKIRDFEFPHYGDETLIKFTAGSRYSAFKRKNYMLNQHITHSAIKGSSILISTSIRPLLIEIYRKHLPLKIFEFEGYSTFLQDGYTEVLRYEKRMVNN